MLKWILIFLVISLIAAVFGYTDISVAAAGVAKFIFFIFITLFVLAVIFALLAIGRKK